MKKKVLLQVMGAVLVAGLMAGCGGTNDTKTEENTKTEAAADNADAKEETDSTEAEDTSEDSASTDPLKKTVQRQMTQLQKQRVQVRILQVVIQQKQTVQRWPTARRQKQQEVLLVQQPRLQTVMHTARLFRSRMEYYSRMEV